MEVLKAAAKKQLARLANEDSSKHSMDDDTLARVETLFHQATQENSQERVNAVEALRNTHEKLHKKTPPPLSP